MFKLKHKLFLTAIVVALLVNSAFAQDNPQQKVKPASRVGGTIGLQIPAKPFQNGIGLNLFFHQTISRSWFLSVDAGYHYNPYTETQIGFKGKTSLSSIPVGLGINAFLFRSGICPYLGLGLGLLNRSWNYVEYQNDKLITSIPMREDVLVFLVPTMGITFPLVKNINLTANMKFHLNIAKEDILLDNMGFNIGAAYLIP